MKKPKNLIRSSLIDMSSTKVIVVTGGRRTETLLLDDNFFETDEYDCTFIGEIEEGVKSVYGQEVIIYVWYELGLRGVIYKYEPGNGWEEHGTTKGYA